MAEESSSAKKMPKTQRSEVMSDDTFETLLESMDENIDSTNVNELLKAMNENSIISNEEAEHIMEIGGANRVVKCGLPEQVRPTDPENRTDVENSISRLLKNDPTLVEINLNNMKRTPLAQIGRLILALQDNTNLKKLSFANTGLTDTAAEPFLSILETNKSLEAVNFETNYLSGDFLARFFKAAQSCPSLYEVKCVNQSVVFSTESEMLIMNAVYKNEHLTKVSANLRHPEARNKVEHSTLRNAETKRRTRRLEAAAEKNNDKQEPVSAKPEKVPEKAKNSEPSKLDKKEKPTDKEKTDKETEKIKAGSKKLEEIVKEPLPTPTKPDLVKKTSTNAAPKVSEKPGKDKQEPGKGIIPPKTTTDNKPDPSKKISNVGPQVPEKPGKEKQEPEKTVVSPKTGIDKKPVQDKTVVSPKISTDKTPIPEKTVISPKSGTDKKQVDLKPRLSIDKTKPESALPGKLDRSKILPAFENKADSVGKEAGKEGASRVYKKASLPRK